MTINLPFNPFLLWGRDRIKKNKNLIVVIVGPTGSGKTYSGIDLALEFSKALGTKFTINGNMDFNFTNLLKKAILPENRTPGTPLLFEEVGATGGGASSREWQNRENINFNSFMQTSRHRNQIVIMTCPDFAFLEKGTRKLVHVLMVMKGIDYKSKISYAKPFILQSDPTTGKVYKKYLRLNYKGKRFTIREIKFNIPPKEIIKEYETQKETYTHSLYSDMVEKKENKKEKPNKICMNCNYTWKSNKEVVAKCPRCFERLDSSQNSIKTLGKTAPNTQTGTGLT